MIGRNTAIRIIAMLMCSGVLYAEEHDVILVKRGETFSQIALKYFGKPVYQPEDGAIAKLSRINPEIKNIDVIYPGERLKISETEARHVASSSVESHALQEVAQAEQTSAPPPVPTPAPEPMPAPSREELVTLTPSRKPEAPIIAAQPAVECGRLAGAEQARGEAMVG